MKNAEGEVGYQWPWPPTPDEEGEMYDLDTW